MVQVSVILPCFRPAMFADSIVKSLSEQIFKDFELILIDDDHTEEFSNLEKKLKEIFVKKKIRIKTGQTNKEGSGPANARNLGIEISESRFLCFFDCDDYWSPNFLDVMVRSIKDIKTRIVVCHYEIVQSKRKFKLKIPPKYGLWELYQSNLLSMPCVIVDSKKINDLFFPLVGHEDYAFWLKIVEGDNDIGVIPDLMVKINKTRGSLSSSFLSGFLWHLKIIMKQRIGIIYKIIFIIVYIINALNKRLSFSSQLFFFPRLK